MKKFFTLMCATILLLTGCGEVKETQADEMLPMELQQNSGVVNLVRK